MGAIRRQKLESDSMPNRLRDNDWLIVVFQLGFFVALYFVGRLLGAKIIWVIIGLALLTGLAMFVCFFKIALDGFSEERGFLRKALAILVAGVMAILMLFFYSRFSYETLQVRFELMDTSWITLATGLVAGLGIGSVITAQIQHALKLKEAAHQSQREALESRYKVVILLMYAAIDFAGNETAIRIHRPDLKNQSDVLDDLRAEWTVNNELFSPAPVAGLATAVHDRHN